MFPFFQSPGTPPDCHELSGIMESGLAGTFTSSLGTLLSTLNASLSKEMTFHSHSHQLFSPFSKKAVGVWGERNNGTAGRQPRELHSHLARNSPGTSMAGASVTLRVACVVSEAEVGARYLETAQHRHPSVAFPVSRERAWQGPEAEAVGLSLPSTSGRSPGRGEQERSPVPPQAPPRCASAELEGKRSKSVLSTQTYERFRAATSHPALLLRLQGAVQNCLLSHFTAYLI